MQPEDYQKRLDECPDHLSDEFIGYLRKNNVVRYETDEYIVIENCKYHTKEKEWLTLFLKDSYAWLGLDGDSYSTLYHKVDNYNKENNYKYNILLRKTSDRTIKRPHIHLYE